MRIGLQNQCRHTDARGLPFHSNYQPANNRDSIGEVTVCLNSIFLEINLPPVQRGLRGVYINTLHIRNSADRELRVIIIASTLTSTTDAALQSMHWLFVQS